MKRTALLALFLLLLLAVAAPICLAAEKGTDDQQPFTQNSKLPPLQFTGNTLTQKEYFQAALWLSQQNLKQISASHAADEWLGLNSTKATVLSSIAALITAVMVPFISIFVARKTMAQTKKSLEDDLTQRKIEQKNNFEFQLAQLTLVEKKKVMIKFFESTSFHHTSSRNIDIEELQTQLTMIKILMDEDFYDISLKIFTKFKEYSLYNSHLRTIQGDSFEAEKYKSLHTALATKIEKILCWYTAPH